MAGRWLIGFAATLAAAGAGAAQNPPAAPPQSAQPFAACEGQRFVFEAGVEPHATKITLCSKKDASKDDLVRMLDSAAAKIQEMDKLPEERRAALVAQLKAKIAEVQATNYAVLPTLPVAPPLAVPVAPPIPTPTPTPIVAKPLPIITPMLTRPRLTLECYTPGEVGGGGPCIALERETLLTVRADDNLAAGTRLRFVRKGTARGELALAPMRAGQSLRMKLPVELCKGVAGGGGDVEIQLVTGGTVVATLGRHPLRC